MIKIQYYTCGGVGEMNIDIVQFVLNHGVIDLKKLIKKVVLRSIDPAVTVNEMRNELTDVRLNKDFCKDNKRFIAKYEKAIELLQGVL